MSKLLFLMICNTLICKYYAVKFVVNNARDTYFGVSKKYFVSLFENVVVYGEGHSPQSPTWSKR